MRISVASCAASKRDHSRAALATELEHDRLPGVLDVVPAARTVLVTLDPRVTTTTAVAAALRSAAGTLGRPTGSATSRAHEISVVEVAFAGFANLAGARSRARSGR